MAPRVATAPAPTRSTPSSDEPLTAELVPIEAPDHGAIGAITRGEIDMQVATAKRYPRSIETFRMKALGMATIDEETAASCNYKLPARKGGDDEEKKAIEGPSIRLAEIVAACYQNLRVLGRIAGTDDRFVYVTGLCWDIENNVWWSADVRRRITRRNGTRYNDDMIAVTTNAALAIAMRNAIFKAVPSTYVNEIGLKCKEVARGTAATLAARRQRAIEWFAANGVKAERVFAGLGVRGIEEITLDHLEDLQGIRTAIREGDLKADEAFADAEVAARADPLSQVMTEVGCSEPDARQLLVAFESLKMNEAHRLVQCKAFKGRAADLLAMLVGMGAKVPEASASATATTVTMPAGDQVNTTTGEVVEQPASSGSSPFAETAKQEPPAATDPKPGPQPVKKTSSGRFSF